MNEQLNILGLLELLIKHWKVIFVSTLITTCLSVFYLNITTYKYTVQLKVIPVSGDNPLANGLSSASSFLSSVTSTSNEDAKPFKLFLESISSYTTAEKLAQRPKIMQKIFKNQWNDSSKEWVEPKGLFTPVKKTIKWLLGMPNVNWHPPSGKELQRYLKDNLTLTTDRKSPVATISIEIKDPDFGQFFLQALYEDIDMHLRKNASDRAAQYIKHLESRLSEVSVIDYRQAILASISQQETTLMRTNPSTSFSATVFDGPVASLKPTSPNTLIILALAIFFGIAFGTGLIIIQEPRFKLGLNSILN